MRSRLVVIGGGGFGREVLDLIDALPGDTRPEVLGVVDDGVVDNRLLQAYSVEHLGPLAVLDDIAPDVGYVVAIGNPSIRAQIDALLRDRRPSPVLIHPSVTMGRRVELGPGSVLCAGARLTNHIDVGRHVHVNLNCTVGHDSTLSDYATLSPLVAISGNVHVGPGAFFGTGAKINPGLRVGGGSVVGTGAAVVREVPQDVTVVGVPARPR